VHGEKVDIAAHPEPLPVERTMLFVSASLIRFLSCCAELVDRISGFAFNILFATRGAHDLGVLFSHVPQKSRERMPAAVANNFDRSGFLVSRTAFCHSGLDSVETNRSHRLLL